MIPVQSSNLQSYEYDPTTGRFSVQFQRGPDIHDYFDVPQSVVDGFISAESKGRYFSSEIRGRFRHEKRAQIL